MSFRNRGIAHMQSVSAHKMATIGKRLIASTDSKNHISWAHVTYIPSLDSQILNAQQICVGLCTHSSTVQNNIQHQQCKEHLIPLYDREGGRDLKCTFFENIALLFRDESAPFKGNSKIVF